MFLSDLSIRRPVFATVLSLLLLAFGILSFNELTVREYPDVSSPVISVETGYPGASADIVESRITQMLEGEISGIEGVRSISSSSEDGRSSIVIEFTHNRNIDDAANDVRDRVSRRLNRLPEGVDLPQISKQDADANPVMWMSIISDNMKLMELTDYVERNIIDRFSVIPGVSNVRVSGSGRPSMRIWLDRVALAARNLTVSDVSSVLTRENIELPAGRLDAKDKEFTVRITRNYVTAQQFRNLVLARGQDGHLVRLGEIARVEVAPQNVRQVFRTNATNMIGMGILKQSNANTVEVLDTVRHTMEQINKELPPGITIVPSSDDSLYIRAAINSVYETIGIAIVLVSLVILLFLGSFRAMLIPVVTIPVSLTGAFIALAAFGYSINLITLLALVLTIGLVVDDSIVVLENVHRRVEGGEPPLLAAFDGTRQVGFAVIATSVVLVAVFSPIIFLRNDTGQLFAELAVTVSAAIIVSTVLALSLTPMMSSKLLSNAAGRRGGELFIDRLFQRVASLYANLLRKSLKHAWLLVAFIMVTGLVSYTLLQTVRQEYAPKEDQGSFRAFFMAAEGTSYRKMKELVPIMEEPILPYLKTKEIARAVVRIPAFNGNSSNTGMMFVQLAPWNNREHTTSKVMEDLKRTWSKIPGVRVSSYMNSGLSHGDGQPVQVFIGGPDYDTLAKWRDQILARAEKNPGLLDIDTDLQQTQPQVLVRIDKDRAAELGVSVQNIGTTLQTMMSEQRITTYVVDGQEYDVILQAEEDQRATPNDLQNIYVRSERSRALIPLTSLTRIENVAGASELNRYNHMRGFTFVANLAPGYTLGEALKFMETIVREELPVGARIDYEGQSLEFKESSGGIYFTFGMALLIVFLVLAAQFESFIHPLTIMTTVPLAMAGGLLGIFITGNTLNIYSQIGMVILIGIASKNGILIVDFINQMRDKGMEFFEAIIEGARLRFRPVVMTTLATVMGSVPLLLARGPGSESRVVLGTVLFTGVSFATFFTLFVVPVFYRLLARSTTSPNAIARKLSKLRETLAQSKA